MTGLSTGSGALMYVSPVDGQGKVVANFSGIIDITLNDVSTNSTSLFKEQGNGVLTGSSLNYQYQYSPSDRGVAIFRYKNTAPETVGFTVKLPNNSFPKTASVLFQGAQKFVVSKSGETRPGTVFETLGMSYNFILRAVLDNNMPDTAYSETPLFTSVSENGSNSSSATITPSVLTFENGEAAFTLSDTEYETVTFTMTGSGLTTGNIEMKFQSTDQNPPEVTKVVAESPWLIHVYFSEEVNEANAMRVTNYAGVGSIDKLCWYGNNITLHLGTALTLGANLNLTLRGTTQGANGIKDNSGNFISGDVVKVFTVPAADYQGHALGGSDWFELQPSNKNPFSGEQVEVRVFHKNACGYLKGSNATNATTPAAGANVAVISYGGGVVTGDSSVPMSDGSGIFKFTPSTSPQSFTVTVSNGGVSGQFTVTVP
jgi:hypothetical protein